MNDDRRPSLAQLRLEMWLWARLMPFLCPKTKPFAEMLKVGHVGSSRRYRGLSVEEITQRVKRTSRHPWLMRDRRCLREGMLAFRFLTLAGVPAQIHFGVDKDSIEAARLAAHCWIIVGGKIVLNPPTPSMVTIFVHGNQIADAS